MTALVASEWRKLRSVRALWGYLAAVVLFAGIGAAGTVGSATAADRARDSFSADLAGLASLAALVALVLGIVVVTGEFRHGTITPTFLATPQRERVLAAKLVFAVLGATALALLALAVVVVVALPWLLALGDSAALDVATAESAGRAILGSVLWAALGLAVGAVVHGQVAALIGTLLWILVVENLLVALLGVLDLDAVSDVLPNAALTAVLEAEADDVLSFWPALAIALAYVVAIGGLGVVRTSRKDVT